MSDLNSRIEAAKAEIANLKGEIDKAKAAKKDVTLGGAARNSTLPGLRAPPAIKSRRTLKGHFGKVTALHWAGDSKSLVSASQDGKLILWNALTTSKSGIVSLKSSYVLTVGMEQKQGDMVACGGLDNLCTVYRFSNPDVAMEMASHEGFLSCCRFLSQEKIITSSGDSTCIVWDIESGRVLDTLMEHKADVMHLSLNPSKDSSTFLTASVDKTVKLWDLRDPSQSVQTFFAHDGDVNHVEFMPSDPNAFGTASDDGTCRIFDLRAYNDVARFGKQQKGGEQEGFTSVSFSRSGRILFAGHANSSILAFDALSDKTSASFVLSGHDAHVTDVGVNPKGDALCSSSWDNLLRIWA